MELRKRIPVQAGLGGGSSDAAAVLRAGMDGAFGPWKARDWLSLARALGSDVPFFLAGTAALVEGTGERVTPAGCIPPWHAADRQAAGRRFDGGRLRRLDRVERPQRPRNSSVSIAMLEALQRADFARVESLLQNDFQDSIASSAPEIAAALAALRAAGASNAILAGSGSCVFTLASDRAQIDRVLERLALPPSYERFATAFATASQWRP